MPHYRFVRQAPTPFALSLAPLLLAAFQLLNGCGSGSDTSTGGSPSTTTQLPTGGSSAGGSSGATGDGGFNTGGGGALPFPRGNIYVAGSRNAEVFEYDPSLNLVSHWTHPSFGVVGPPLQNLSNGPAGMVFDSHGYLVVAGLAEFCVFSAPNTVLACHPKHTQEPTENIIFDSDGNLYTTTSTGGTNKVVMYNSDYIFVKEFPLDKPNLTGITCDSTGNLFVASQDGATSNIYKLSKSTLETLGTIPVSGMVEGLQFSTDETILAAVRDIGVQRLETTNQYQVLFIYQHANLQWPVPLTTDTVGRIYTADYENGDGSLPADLFIFDVDGATTLTVPSDIYGPFGMVVSGAVLPCGAFQPPQ